MRSAAALTMSLRRLQFQSFCSVWQRSNRFPKNKVIFCLVDIVDQPTKIFGVGFQSVWESLGKQLIQCWQVTQTAAQVPGLADAAGAVQGVWNTVSAVLIRTVFVQKHAKTVQKQLKQHV